MTESSPASRSSDAQAWVLRSRALLQRSADDLEGAARSRLNRSRQAALDQLAGRATTPAWLRGFGLAAVGLGLVLVVWRGLVPLWVPESPTPQLAQPTLSPMPTDAAPAPRSLPTQADEAPVAAPDFELLVDAENYPMLEDLEFYAWLEQAEDRDG